MYKGKRDPMFEIVVPQSCCTAFTDRSGKEWIEVFIPPKCFYNVDMLWSSIALPPEQVFFIDNTYNMICVNAGAVLTCLFKTMQQDGTRLVIDSETDSVEFILARFLAYEWYMNKHTLMSDIFDMNVIYQHFVSTGLTMMSYINKFCR